MPDVLHLVPLYFPHHVTPVTRPLCDFRSNCYKSWHLQHNHRKLWCHLPRLERIYVRAKFRSLTGLKLQKFQCFKLTTSRRILKQMQTSARQNTILLNVFVDFLKFLGVVHQIWNRKKHILKKWRKVSIPEQVCSYAFRKAEELTQYSYGQIFGRLLTTSRRTNTCSWPRWTSIVIVLFNFPLGDTPCTTHCLLCTLRSAAFNWALLLRSLCAVVR